MIGKSVYQPRQLQQQPQRSSNRLQQQSSGSGEFQPPRLRSTSDKLPSAQHTSAAPPAS